MGVVNVLNKSTAKADKPKDKQYNGLKLSKEDSKELYTIFDIPEQASGKNAFDSLISYVTGVEMPDKEIRSADGSIYVGRAQKMTKTGDIFESHPDLCTALGLPEAAGGVLVFKTLLTKAIEKKNAELVSEGKPELS